MEFETIRKIIAEKMEIDESKITLDSTLQDLDIDSLDMVDIIMDIENELNISLEDLKDVEKVGDVVDFVKKVNG